MGEAEGFPERMRFEIDIKRWVPTGQESRKSGYSRKREQNIKKQRRESLLCL